MTVLSFLLSSSLALAALAQSTYTLDLVTAPRPPALFGRSSGRGCDSGFSGEVRPKPPLEITLAGLDRAEYDMREPFDFVVIIRNVGTKEYVMPWLAYQDPLVPEAKEYRLILFLQTTIAGRLIFLGSATLSGEHDRPGTFVRLQPGETARIRMPGGFFGGSIEDMRALAAASDLTLAVQLLEQIAECKWAPPIGSTNTIAIKWRGLGGA